MGFVYEMIFFWLLLLSFIAINSLKLDVSSTTGILNQLDVLVFQFGEGCLLIRLCYIGVHW